MRRTWNAISIGDETTTNARHNNGERGMRAGQIN